MDSTAQTDAVLPSNDVNNIPIIFREIHKNAWLRRLPVNNDRKTGAYSKRGETVWVVFCVHDDTDPYLEVYVEQKVAAAHRPDWCAPLSACLHVTPTISATQEDYHEFVVTLRSGIVKLAAPTWDVMMEWVNTLRSKLTEMKILNPAENVYSQMPQIMRPLLPTRDPNSPLPPTPAGPVSLVPGIDLDVSTAPTTSENANTGSNIASRAPAPVPIASTSGPTSIQTPSTLGPIPTTSVQRNLNSTPIQSNSVRVQPNSASLNQNSASSLASNVLVQPNSILQPIVASRVQQNSAQTNVNLTRNPPITALNSILQPIVASNSRIQTSTNITVQPSSASIQQSSAQANSILQPVPASRGQPNVTVQSVLNPDTRVQPNVTVQPVLNPDSRVQLLSSIPPIPRVQAISRAQSFSSGSTAVQPNSTEVQQNSAANLRSASSTTSLYITQSEPPVYTRATPNLNRTISEPSQNITVIEVSGPMDANTVFDFTNMSDTITSMDSSYYEHLYPNQSEPMSPLTPLDTPISSIDTPMSDTPIETPPRQTSRSEIAIEEPILSPRNRRTRPIPIDTPPMPDEAPIVSPRNERRRPRAMIPPPRVLGSVPCPFRPPPIVPTMLTLREQQVLQLTREIRHPGGVRLQIRRKDCCGSIALVDAFGAVWVAGWKQREHPTLYNALHIGDRLLSVAGVPVPSAADANRIIRSANCLFIEFIVRRVPFGRILAIKRDQEGQDLGLELEGGSSEVKLVRGTSPAARAGLPPKAPTCDGLSLCNWVLTEVNSRPLNLFFKDNEAKDRLNAVGMDVSILVQPFDLVKQLKKQLKSFRGYKEYLVQ